MRDLGSFIKRVPETRFPRGTIIITNFGRRLSSRPRINSSPIVIIISPKETPLENLESCWKSRELNGVFQTGMFPEIRDCSRNKQKVCRVEHLRDERHIHPRATFD